MRRKSMFLLMAPIVFASCMCENSDASFSKLDEYIGTKNSLLGVHNSHEDTIALSYVEELTQTYLLATQVNATTESKIKFFDLFPTNFSTFKELYAFEQPLDDVGHKHVKLIRQIDSLIDEVKYYEKIIGVCIGGTYKVKGVGSLQLMCSEKFEGNPEKFCKHLSSSFLDQEVLDFFDFYFSAIHPEVKWQDGFPLYIENMKNEYPEIVGAARIKYKELVTDYIANGNHKH
jgi:hypothetical protein